MPFAESLHQSEGTADGFIYALSTRNVFLPHTKSLLPIQLSDETDGQISRLLLQ